MVDLNAEMSATADSQLASRTRVCSRARGWDAQDVASERRATEDHLRFARSSGEQGVEESERLEAELVEWRRIEALLAAAPDARYDPAGDPVAVCRG
jgi:hypothetical protein